MSTPTSPVPFEERLLEQIKHIVAETPAPLASSRTPTRPLSLTVTRLALVALPVGVVVATIFLLGSSRPGIAQAGVVSRAAAALEQPGTILHLQVTEYTSGTICISEGGCTPINPTTAKNGISANPAEDAVSNTYQEWLSTDGSRRRIVEGDGQELVSNAETSEQVSYNPVNHRLTTITAGTVPSSSFVSPTISYLQNLYREAQAGRQNLELVGQTTISGESVYELRLDSSALPPGNMCGTEVCKPPVVSVLIYLDSQTFVPVRTVIENPNQAASGHGSVVRNVTDFATQRLPNTSANKALLEMPVHRDATAVMRTQAQPAEPEVKGPQQ
jgi:hypothetical protein